MSRCAETLLHDANALPGSTAGAIGIALVWWAGVVAGAAGQTAGKDLAPPPPTPEDSALYALAVDPADYPGEEIIVVLDEGRVRLAEDGSSSTTFRTVQQVRSDAAARSAAELSFGYHADREAVTLDWARVVDRDGTVVSGPVHVQVTDAPVARRSPVYSDMKMMRGSLGGVEPGRIVDVQHTRRVLDPLLPGDVFQRWTVNPGVPVLRSRFVLDTPIELEPMIHTSNLPAPARITRTGGRMVREWSYEDIAPVERELFAADSNDVAMSVAVAGPLSWDDLGRWYAGLAANRYRITPDVEAALAAQVKGATTLEDSLRSVHRWVAQDIRYVSLSLGVGGYQPRTPEEVVRTGVGDCKDKATLFIAAARHFGTEAYPVLVRTTGRVDLQLPTRQQFNHMVAALRLGDGWRYLDLTVPVAPFDQVFGPLQGRRGILLHDDGGVEPITFPTAPADSNRSVIRITGELESAGTLTAEYTETVAGALQYRIRGEFAAPLNERQKQAVRLNLAQRVARGGRTDSMEVFDGLDLEATPRLWAHVTADEVLEQTGDAWLLPLRLQSYASPALIQRLEAEADRRFPIDAQQVFGRKVHRTEYSIQLPEGWTADLPRNVRAASAFGVYESRYAQEGRRLSIVRAVHGTDAVLPPDAIGDLIAWFRAIEADRVEHIVLHPPTAATGFDQRDRPRLKPEW